MGNRVSIQFVDQFDQETPVLCHHWGGEWFPQEALKFAKKIQEKVKPNNGLRPLDRLEARVMFVHFIAELAPELDSLYVGRTPRDVDNSDNGHWIIHLYQTAPIRLEGPIKTWSVL